MTRKVDALRALERLIATLDTGRIHWSTEEAAVLRFALLDWLEGRAATFDRAIGLTARIGRPQETAARRWERRRHLLVVRWSFFMVQGRSPAARAARLSRLLKGTARHPTDDELALVELVARVAPTLPASESRLRELAAAASEASGAIQIVSEPAVLHVKGIRHG